MVLPDSTDCDVIAGPRSEWITSAATPPLARMQFCMNRLAMWPDSLEWTSQCTTYRE